MKEIKKTTEKIENEAYKNVEDFDFTKLCLSTVFEILNNGGVFIKLFDELFCGCVEDESQITLKTFKYGYVKENDLKVYPMVDLIVTLLDSDADVKTDFCLSLTPFTAGLDNLEKDSGIYGIRDRELTKIWRIIMKGFFQESWENAFEEYCLNVERLGNENSVKDDKDESVFYEQEGQI